MHIFCLIFGLGVFFLGWETDEVVVIKGSSTVLADELAFLLGKECHMPIPEMRTVRYIYDLDFDVETNLDLDLD